MPQPARSARCTTAASSTDTAPSGPSSTCTLSGTRPKTLRELETEWSGIALKQGAEPIVLVNDIDGELPSAPSDFKWVESEYLILPGCEPDPQYTLHCDGCSPCGIGDPCECIAADDKDFDGAYDQGFLRAPLIDCVHGFIIRECNSVSACNCGDACLNKASQQQRRWTAEIFKTSNARGWGVRAQANLQRGEILGLYTGELRPPSEDTDENETDRKIGDNFDYVFALDGDSDYDADTVWSVDAYRAGNWTRFANHSCDPNMRIYSRSLGEVTRPDNELLYLVLVARQDIPAGTELTFDYRPVGATEGGQPGRQECLCGSTNCRGQLWT